MNGALQIVRSRYVCCFFVMLLVCSSSIKAHVIDSIDNVKATIPSVGETKIRVHLHTMKTHLLLGEPVWLTLSLENAGDDDISIIRCSSPGYDYLNYEIIEPNKQPQTVQPDSTLFESGVAKRTIRLIPFDIFSRTDYLIKNRNSLLINNPGEYVIHALYCLPDGVPGGPLTIRSNGVCIVGEKPTGIDKEAYDELIEKIAKNRKNGEIWTADSTCINDYEDIALKYPQSRYTVYIRYYLAQAYEFRGKNITRGTNDGISSIHKAINNYETVVKLLGDTPMGNDAMKLAGRCYATLGKTGNAEEAYRIVFCSTNESIEQKIEILSWIRLLELGTFYLDSGLAKNEEKITNDILLPLLPYARALGYDIMTDMKSGKSVIIRGDYKLVIRPGDDLLPVRGTIYKDMRVKLDKDGGFSVSPSVIAMLLAERYGKDMARQLAFMLIKAK